MLSALRSFTKTLPLLFTALLLAVAVWIMAVTSSDPSLEKVYPNSIPVEVIGQSPDMVIVTDLPDEIELTLRAPTSIWQSLLAEKVPVRAILDLTGLSEGEHTIPVQIQIGIKPVEIVGYNPRSVNLEFEPLKTEQFTIRVINQGTLAVGYQSNPAELSETTVTVSGAKSHVERVNEVRAVVKLTDANSNIDQTITLQPVDVNGSVVREVSLTPEKITLTQQVFERGGYRNVVVKVVTSGLIADGFRLTNITVSPPTITVFANDPALVDSLPGYVETIPIDLTKKVDNFESSVELNLPQGVQVIESSTVEVSVGIEPIQSSLSLTDVPVEADGLSPQLTAIIEPQKVNLIISGPLSVLDSLNVGEVRVLVNLMDKQKGHFTFEPEISLNVPDLQIESISPTTFVVDIQ